VRHATYCGAGPFHETDKFPGFVGRFHNMPTRSGVIVNYQEFDYSDITMFLQTSLARA
jgi:hypothetical protein